MGIVKRARLKQKEDVDLEVYYDEANDAYVMTMANNTTKATHVINKGDFADPKRVCKFLMKHLKMTYNCI